MSWVFWDSPEVSFSENAQENYPEYKFQNYQFDIIAAATSSDMRTGGYIRTGTPK